MVAGHLQEKKGLFYMVLSFKDENGKRQTPWIPTGLPVRGNKKKAEEMLLKFRNEFKINKEETSKTLEIECSVKVSDPADQLFSDFLLYWLRIEKTTIELVTYSAYAYTIKNKIAPYFARKGVTLKNLTTKDIQDYYIYESENGVSSNTIIHYHANIRKALAHAVKNDMIMKNPADEIEKPKIERFKAGFYSNDELNKLFEIVKGTNIEFPVLMAAFYGLRRSEVVGLKWKAIDVKNKSISIEHTVTQASVDGEYQLIPGDRTKNKSSLRSLPLVPQFERLLSEMKERQTMNRNVCGKCYCEEDSEYIYVNDMGQLYSPNYITQKYPAVLEKNCLRKIRFHDLRHSCASLLLANGISMKEIQEWLGHSDFSTTANIYAHLDYSSKIASARLMNECLQIAE